LFLIVRPFCSVYVLVAHYQFDGKGDLSRAGNGEDVFELKTTFSTNRTCNFVDLASPTKKELLEILQDDQQLCQQFGVAHGKIIKMIKLAISQFKFR